MYPASLMSVISGKLEQHADPLQQDLTEGVDEDEWVGTLLHLLVQVRATGPDRGSG